LGAAFFTKKAASSQLFEKSCTKNFCYFNRATFYTLHMIQLAARQNYLRQRNGQDHAPVASIELFFDLVFVFAIIQLSHELRTHLSAIGFLHSLILFGAVWWVWVSTSWITNWLDPKHRPVQIMLLTLMLFALVLATALPDAFGARGRPFAIVYAIMQLGRTLFMLWAVRRFDDANYRNLRRTALWVGLSTIFWLVGGFCPAAARTILWLAALALDFSSLGPARTAEWSIDTYHLAERCAGFILIALGESILITGGMFVALRWSQRDALAFPAAFLGIVSLWWIYFDKAAEHTAEAFARAADPGRIARTAYTYMHALLVAAIIGVSAGDAFLLEQPAAPVTLKTGLLMLGSPALYLAGNGVFRWLLHRHLPRSHVYGVLLLGLLALGARFLTLSALAWLSSLILVLVILFSDVLFSRQEQPQE
jgi:low temperature requirement protein LtrA